MFNILREAVTLVSGDFEFFFGTYNEVADMALYIRPESGLDCLLNLILWQMIDALKEEEPALWCVELLD